MPHVRRWAGRRKDRYRPSSTAAISPTGTRRRRGVDRGLWVLQGAGAGPWRTVSSPTPVPGQAWAPGTGDRDRDSVPALQVGRPAQPQARPRTPPSPEVPHSTQSYPQEASASPSSPFPRGWAGLRGQPGDGGGRPGPGRLWEASQRGWQGSGPFRNGGGDKEMWQGCPGSAGP